MLSASKIFVARSIALLFASSETLTLLLTVETDSPPLLVVGIFCPVPVFVPKSNPFVSPLASARSDAAFDADISNFFVI